MIITSLNITNTISRADALDTLTVRIKVDKSKIKIPTAGDKYINVSDISLNMVLDEEMELDSTNYFYSAFLGTTNNHKWKDYDDRCYYKGDKLAIVLTTYKDVLINKAENLGYNVSDDVDVKYICDEEMIKIEKQGIACIGQQDVYIDINEIVKGKNPIKESNVRYLHEYSGNKEGTHISQHFDDNIDMDLYDILLTDKEKEEIDAGNTMDIFADTKENTNDLSKSDLKKVKSKLPKNYKIIKSIDIQLYKQMKHEDGTEGEVLPITNVIKGKLDVEAMVPRQYIGSYFVEEEYNEEYPLDASHSIYDYKVIQIHENKMKEIDAYGEWREGPLRIKTYRIRGIV